MWIIVFLVCSLLFVFFALIKMGDTEIKEEQSSATHEDMSVDAADAAKTALTGMMMVDAMHRIDQWRKEKKERDYYDYRWQEEIRDKYPSFKEHYDDDDF